MVKIITQSLEVSTADLVVIPKSTAGTISGAFQAIINQLDNGYEIFQSDLGDVALLPVTGNSKWRYVALACSVNDFKSSYTALYQIIRNLFEGLPADVKTVALPLLGTGAGGMDPIKAFQILSKSIDELAPVGINVNIHILDLNLHKTLDQATGWNLTVSARRLAFDFIIDDIIDITWVKDQMTMADFYFDFARSKFLEYQSHNLELSFYQLLGDLFGQSNKVFSKFLFTIAENSREYDFLVLCGQLVAYIDKHAYNKDLWNSYPDKRTLARSSVNQTRWIQNLIKFKAGKKNHYSVLTPSISNAFAYLQNPSKNLTMLSANHRYQVGKVFFDISSDEELLPAVEKYFIQKGIKCTNPYNNGSLYSRILYMPDVKSLWIIEPITATVKDWKLPKQIIGSSQKDINAQLPEQNIKVAEITDAEMVRQRNLKLLMHSDLYATVDLLNYETYAAIIARLITSDLSKPPFNISILAPWGKGKTTLMRFIQNKINPKISDLAIKEKPVSSIMTLMSWLKTPDKILSDLKKLDHPVIWFNAWKFQKSEQVWSGLADEVIRQLSTQLSSVDQERFWFKLNLKRIDRDKIKRELLFKSIQKLLIPLLYAFFGLFLSWVLDQLPWRPYLNSFFRTYPVLISGIPLFVGIFVSTKQVFSKWQKPPEIDAGKFVLQPEYRSKMGYLQAVEDDLRQAIEIVINPEKPAVIFIDDLDRCSPTVIADVVEAINAFMSGDLSKCYFIIGQDPQMVTASLDVTYEKIAGKIGRFESQHASIGRSFLEKFSQLTINIPVMDGDQKKQFIDSLLSTIDLESIPTEEEQRGLIEAYQNLQIEVGTLSDPEDIFTEKKDNIEKRVELFNRQLVLSFQDSILATAFKNYRIEDNELENIIIYVAEYLDSPRTIKRFLNLFLFYHFFRFTIPGKKLLKIDDQTLGLWIVIMVRWPLLVQAIQWDTEKGFFTGSDCLERARKFDELIDGNGTFDDYIISLKRELGEGLTWQCDQDLYELCKGKEKSSIKLEQIVISGIW